jgi:hypothetical protein
MLSSKRPDILNLLQLSINTRGWIGRMGTAIRDSTTEPLAGFLPPEMNTLTTWVNKVRDF